MIKNALTSINDLWGSSYSMITNQVLQNQQSSFACSLVNLVGYPSWSELPIMKSLGTRIRSIPEITALWCQEPGTGFLGLMGSWLPALIISFWSADRTAVLLPAQWLAYQLKSVIVTTFTATSGKCDQMGIQMARMPGTTSPTTGKQRSQPHRKDATKGPCSLACELIQAMNQGGFHGCEKPQLWTSHENQQITKRMGCTTAQSGDYQAPYRSCRGNPLETN